MHSSGVRNCITAYHSMNIFMHPLLELWDEVSKMFHGMNSCHSIRTTLSTCFFQKVFLANEKMRFEFWFDPWDRLLQNRQKRGARAGQYPV